MTEPTPKEYHDRADVSARRVAKVYAAALVKTAEQRGEAEGVLAELDSLVRDVFEKDARLEILLTSAAIGRHARREALQRLFVGRASATFANFVQVLNDHERLSLLRPISTAAIEMHDER